MAMQERLFHDLILCFLVLALTACGSKKPAVVDESLKSPQVTISHVALTESCSDCHEQDRKVPAEDLNLIVQHGLGADCASCHAFPQFSEVKQEIKAHNPPPKVCMGCHSRATEGTVHPPFGECATCHQFGAAWVPK